MITQINHLSCFSYTAVTNTTLQCRLESDEVGESFSPLVFLSSHLISSMITGLFNVTIMVTNGYGRSKVDESLVRISSTGQRYTLETYSSEFFFFFIRDLKSIQQLNLHLALSSITPANGSESGGSQLTLTGAFFSQTDENPLVINVDDVSCSLLRWNAANIECQISKRTTNNRTNYAGKHTHTLFSLFELFNDYNLYSGNRGCHIYMDTSFIDLAIQRCNI